MTSVYRYGAALFDLFGTLVDGRGNACAGAREAIATVGSLPWAIVTSCPRELAYGLLREARLTEPAVLVGAEDVARAKPAPEGYLRAAELLGIAADRCVVFEDSRASLASASAAGMGAVSVIEGWERIELAVDDGELTITLRGRA